MMKYKKFLLGEKGKEVFVGALQTTYLKKIFEIFKPEQIRKIEASGSIVNTQNIPIDNVYLSGVRYDSRRINFSYNKRDMFQLDDEEVKKVLDILKNNGIVNLAISELEVEFPIDYSMFSDKIPNDAMFVAKFRCEDCPNDSQLKESLRNLNVEVADAKDRNLFRYRQLLLTYLIQKDQEENLPISRRVPMIDLDLNWIKLSDMPKYGSGLVGSSKNTVIGVWKSIGKYLVQQNYKLKDNKTWEFNSFS